MFDLYSLMFFVHMLGLIGWAGITTGAYFLIVLTGLDSESVLVGYRKLVILEIVSLVAMGLSGMVMWHMLDRPTWAYPSFALFPVLAFGEYYHYRLTFKDVVTFKRRMRYLSWYYTIVGLFLIFDMTFKPEI